MSDAAPLPHRVVLSFSAQPDGEIAFTIETDAPDLLCLELLTGLNKIQGHFLKTPLARILTRAEAEADRAQRERMKAFPAVRFAVKDGRQVWLGAVALEAGVLTRLAAAGWVDAGEPPAGVVRPCDVAADPDAFEAAHFPKEEAAN